MESTDSSSGSAQQPNLPPGFRFHPTDEELVVHYLKKKTTSAPLPVAIIAEVDLYKFDPWELPAKATFGEQEWFFFSPRDRKYPNGARPNRAATSGYWKATGTDKPVLATGGNHKVGVKKALVFYGGKPPKGIKTNWIMHEYRLADNKTNNKPPGCDYGKKNSLRLDDWVLCRIYKKNNLQRPMDRDQREDSFDEMMGHVPPSLRIDQTHQNMKLNLPKTATSYSALLATDQNLLQAIMSNEGINNPMAPQTSTDPTYSNSFPLKRTLPSLCWNDNQDGLVPSSNKRLQLESVDHGTIPSRRTDHANGSSSSIASLLSQLPQTPQLHQQTTLESLGDGLLRLPYHQLQGMNWYS